MKNITLALKYIYVGLLVIWSTNAGLGAFPSGTPVTPYLTGQNYWFFSPTPTPTTMNSGVIVNSGVTIMRIGGHGFDETAPLTDAELLQQVDFIRSMGIEPLIQVSRFRTAADAANTVQYINITHGRNVKFWLIGNEPDLDYAGTEAQLVAEVATYIKQFSPAMRDVDPSITIIAPDLAFYSAAKYDALLGGVADITGKDAQDRYYVDCISFHRYGSTAFTRADALNDMHGEFENNRVVPLVNRIAYANALQGRNGSSALTWALTEFNITTANPASGNNPAGYGVSSFLNGQFFAEYYRVAMKHGVAMMNTWSMRESSGNGGTQDLGYIGGTWAAPVLRSSYYHMQMIANYLLPGGYIDGSSSTANVAVLSTSSSTQATLSVMLLNEDAFDHTFSLRLDGGTVLGAGDTKINVAANLAAEYSGTIGQQSTVVLVFDATGGLLKRVTYSLALNISNAAPVVEIFNAAAAPTFSPAAGAYAIAQSITISSTTPGVSIRYTTDGSTPSSSTGTLYSGPVAISTGSTFKAVAYSTDFTDSGITTGAYTIGASVPAAPSLTATAASATRINLSWSVGVGATSYNVKRSSVNGGPYAAIATGIASTTFSDVGLTPNTTYYYVVSGINANGESPNSSQASATTFTPAIGTTAAFEAESLSRTVIGASGGAVVNAEASASNGNWVQLNASAAGQAVEFTTGSVAAGTYDLQLTYKTGASRGQLNLTVDGVLIGNLDQYAASSSFLTATLGSITFNSSGTHLVRLTVTGKNAVSTNFLLSADRFIFLAQTNQVAVAPTGVMAANGDARVVLNWTASPGAASHQVKRATVAGGPYTTIATGIITPTFTDTAVTNGTTYYYVVSAVNAFGESPNSFEVFATPQAGTASLSFEAELLTGWTTVPVGASTVINSDALTSGGKWVQLSANGTAQSITFTTTSVSAGTYTLQLSYKSGNNRAQVGVAVDGVTVGGTIDQYNATNTYPTATVGAVTFASTGTHTIKLTTTGRNAANTTGYAVSADKFTLAGRSAATLTLGNLVQTYDGTPKAVSRTTTPSGLSVIVTYNGGSTVPTAAGAYQVLATINDLLFYSTVCSTLVIAPAPATVTLGSLTHLYDGEPNAATATTSPTGLSVAITYNGSPTAPTDAGSYTVVASISDANYSGSATGTLVIGQAASSITWNAPAAISYGTALGSTQLNATANTAGTFTYTPAAGTVLNVGANQVMTATFTPADTVNFTGASATTTITVNKATSSITLGDLAPIYDGTPKSAIATTTPAGLPVTLTYDGSTTAPTDAGSYVVAATINHPNHLGTATATLVIVKSTSATITLAPLTQRYDGTAKTVMPTTTPADLAVTVTYDGTTTAPIYPGSYTVVATISDANYSVTKTDTLVITVTALVRHAPTLNGIVDGSIQVLLPESLTLNGNAAVSGDILVPGTPTIRLNGNPTLAGTKDGPGSAAPASHTVTLNSGAVLCYLVWRVNAITLPTVAAPTAPAGIRNVTLNNSTDPIGSFATLRNLTLNGNVCPIAVPPGAYGNFIANGSGSFVLGTAGSTTPAVYHLQGLTLNAGGAVQIVGPVIIRLASGVTLNGSASCGTVDHPEWLNLEVYSGGVTLNSNATVHGFITAPAGTVTINGNATIHGGVSSDRLTINGNGLLSENEP